MKRISKLLIVSALSAGLTFSSSFSLCQAYTDNASVLNGVDKSTESYSYLNDNGYHFVARQYSSDWYASNDNGVIFNVGHDDGNIYMIYILKGGHPTDKGIEVGMTLNDIEYAYGKAYKESDFNSYTAYHDFIRYNNDAGNYYVTSKTTGNIYKNYFGYDYTEYVTQDNSGLSFIFNRYTKKIAMIRYQSDRHGSSRIIDDVKDYRFLPELR